jgi:hypothetical protein
MTKPILCAFAAAAALTLAAPPAAAQVRWNFEYAVKVVCGNVDRGGLDQPLAVGRYFTAVNLHNPGAGSIYFRNKVAVARTEPPGPISTWGQHGLNPDEAREIDCAQISKQAKADWVKGFLVIQSNQPLDLVAVYTTSGRDEYVNTFHTERVPPRPIQ